MSLLSSAFQLSVLEDMCKKYAEPVGESEESRCERAERMIKGAIQQSNVFDAAQMSNISIFAQGSYRNGTNVPQESDVDIAICYRGSFFYDTGQLSPLATFGLGITPAAYTYDQFKADVLQALRASFGQELQIGNKSLRIRPNSGRVSADAVPSFEFRLFRPSGGPMIGTRFIANDGKIITNWPDHHYYFGVEKNKATGFRFKKVVRILKSLREDIRNSGYAAIADTPSFFIECLAWNAPDADFQNESLLADCESVLQSLFLMLQDVRTPQSMVEVNQMKLLFSNEQPWSVQDAQYFVLCAGKELKIW
ncbi:MAG: nucleotidyltransferase [Alphaproteobacteria bacterium]|nr:nucleotidyltransferase [Alphaproteobacteria bacterium]